MLCNFFKPTSANNNNPLQKLTSQHVDNMQISTEPSWHTQTNHGRLSPHVAATPAHRHRSTTTRPPTVLREWEISYFPNQLCAADSDRLGVRDVRRRVQEVTRNYYFVSSLFVLAGRYRSKGGAFANSVTKWISTLWRPNELNKQNNKVTFRCLWSNSEPLPCRLFEGSLNLAGEPAPYQLYTQKHASRVDFEESDICTNTFAPGALVSGEWMKMHASATFWMKSGVFSLEPEATTLRTRPLLLLQAVSLRPSVCLLSATRFSAHDLAVRGFGQCFCRGGEVVFWNFGVLDLQNLNAFWMWRLAKFGDFHSSPLSPTDDLFLLVGIPPWSVVRNVSNADAF